MDPRRARFFRDRFPRRESSPMRAFCFAAIGLSVAAAGIFGWRTTRTRLHRGIGSPYVQPFVTRSGIQSLQTSVSQVPSAAASANESAKHLGPFAVAGRDYTVELQTRKVRRTG